jgi:hypothetical protein
MQISAFQPGLTWGLQVSTSYIHVTLFNWISVWRITEIYESITVGFEVEGDEFVSIPSMTRAQIASRSFIQFDDISAKFSTTARVSGNMDIAGIGNIGVENATINFAFGFGIVEISDKIYFSEISSMLLALKDLAVWQKVGVMDISLPLIATIEFADGFDLTLGPLISITCPDLFTPEFPSMSIDLNLE